MHDKGVAAKKRATNKYQRELYTKTKKRKRAERIATNKVKREAKAQARAEKKAAKAAKAAARLAAKNKPGPRLQAILDSYQGGLAAGWERGRLFERLNGPDVTTPDVL